MILLWRIVVSNITPNNISLIILPLSTYVIIIHSIQLYIKLVFFSSFYAIKTCMSGTEGESNVYNFIYSFVKLIFFYYLFFFIYLLNLYVLMQNDKKCCKIFKLHNLNHIHWLFKNIKSRQVFKVYIYSHTIIISTVLFWYLQ